MKRVNFITSLTFLLGLFLNSPAQVIKIDTIITVPFESFSGNYVDLFVYNSEVHFAAYDDSEYKIQTFNLNTSSQNIVSTSALNLPNCGHTFIINDDIVFGNSVQSFKKSMGAETCLPLEVDLKLTTFAGTNSFIAIDDYPDFFNPKPEVTYNVYSKDYELMGSGALPFDFPNYLARVGCSFAIKDSLLLYCHTTNYQCFLFNLHTQQSTMIIDRELNDSAAIAKIEQLKKEVMQPKTQPISWIPKLQELDREINRVERVLFDGENIITVKRTPDSEWDYRLIDLYKLKNNEVELICSDVKLPRIPGESVSYDNPPIAIMDSNPILLHDSKLYIVNQADYTEGFKEGISVLEFIKNFDQYYENNIPKYSVYVYSIGPCGAD